MEIPGLHMLQSSELEAHFSPEAWNRLQAFDWIALGREDFQVLFVHLDSGVWEGHWKGTEARTSFKFCKKALLALEEQDPGCEVRGVTPCENKRALKMAKLLGFKPLGFKIDNDGKVSLCSVWKGDRNGKCSQCC